MQRKFLWFWFLSTVFGGLMTVESGTMLYVFFGPEANLADRQLVEWCGMLPLAVILIVLMLYLFRQLDRFASYFKTSIPLLTTTRAVMVYCAGESMVAYPEPRPWYATIFPEYNWLLEVFTSTSDDPVFQIVAAVKPAGELDFEPFRYCIYFGWNVPEQVKETMSLLTEPVGDKPAYFLAARNAADFETQLCKVLDLMNIEQFHVKVIE